MWYKYYNCSYKNYYIDDKYKFDVCFIGGRANNGFDEKYKIMLDVFKEFKNSNLKCGFFIDKNLSHEQEKNILFNSKICINIHDAYQRKLGLDTNERTFKSLGINGILVSDTINQIKKISNNIFFVNNSQEYLQKCEEILSIPENEILEIKSKNIDNINKNHTYTSRILSML